MPYQLTRRLDAFIVQLVKLGLDGFIIGREDMYQGEEVPPCDERLAYISGFTGSAGFAFVTRHSAALFSDGRYNLQMRAQTDQKTWQCNTMPDTGLNDWLLDHPIKNMKIGIDSRLVTMTGYDRFYDSVDQAGGVLQLVEDNPVDLIWQGRPKMPLSIPWRMADTVAGQTVSEKFIELSNNLDKQNVKAAFLSRADAVNWLVNMRGGDLPYTPVNLCFALFHSENGLVLLGEKERLAPVVDQNIGVSPLEELNELLAPLSGEVMMIEPASLPKSLEKLIVSSAVNVVEAECPVSLMKARKNQIEIDGFYSAHLNDGIAMTEFLMWFQGITPNDYTEHQIANILEGFRSKNPDYLGPSFATIAGAGPNGAIVHYHAIAGDDRKLNYGDILLLDSGGHYQTGTTDITRTVLIGNDPLPSTSMAEVFTHVLRGHIALATTSFEYGTTGQQLDGIARAPLWEAGLKFTHGTGHGVGHVLSVHEGPASISKLGGMIIEEGMVFSNEPGYYVPEEYGIRLENLLVVRPASLPGFLCFDTLTLCPFDRRLILPKLMSTRELGWLNDYHEQIIVKLVPHLSTDCQQWLRKACAPL